MRIVKPLTISAGLLLVLIFGLLLLPGDAQAADYDFTSVQGTTLVKRGGTWYYVKDGALCYDTTLVKFSGQWYYVSGGKVVSGATELVKFNGSWYYVYQGKVASKTTTLVKYNGEWWYVVNGKVASNTTTLVKYNGEWWYVVKGKIASNTTTLVKFNGGWYYICRGKLAANTTTVYKFNGSWYYIKNGKTQPTATTLVKYNNQWYYVKNGVIRYDTLFVDFNGKTYYVKNGVAQTNYSGKVDYNGNTYYLRGGALTDCHIDGHSYQNSACVHCGTVNAYDALCRWVMDKGTYEEKCYSVDYWTQNVLLSLTYAQDATDGLYVYSGTLEGGIYCCAYLYLDDFSYYCGVDANYMLGTIDPSSFTKASAIPYESFEGPEEILRSYSKGMVCGLIEFLQTVLQTNELGITIEDLGFTAYQ